MKIRTITVRLPEETILWLDSLVKAGIYKSRSEAIREFAREFLEEDYSETRSAENAGKNAGKFSRQRGERL